MGKKKTEAQKSAMALGKRVSTNLKLRRKSKDGMAFPVDIYLGHNTFIDEDTLRELNTELKMQNLTASNHKERSGEQVEWMGAGLTWNCYLRVESTEKVKVEEVERGVPIPSRR